MASDIEQAIRQICDEKGLSFEAVIETIESALAAAYRKDYGDKMQNLEAEFDPATGNVRMFDVKTVLEDIPEEELERMKEKQAQEAAERDAAEAAKAFTLTKRETPEGEMLEELEEEGPKFNPKTEMMLVDAKVLKMDAKVGDVIRTELPIPGAFGRMAAMTAKQVITQKLREAEREIVYSEYKEQEGEVLIGTVQRREGRVVLVDIGRTVGILLPEDQIPGERYNPGDRIKIYVREVTLGTRGPQITLSRTSEELVRILFEIEIPEAAEGTVEIKSMAREAGSRTKVAVTSKDESVDPIGACIGQRGIRIQTIINELGGEKIDVIEWSDDPAVFITNALSPAKVKEVELNDEEKTAVAIVAADQLSLAIGRGGQNVRLAARLTGYKLSVRDEGASGEAGPGLQPEAEAAGEVSEVTEEVSEEAKEVTEETKEGEEVQAVAEVEEEPKEELKEDEEK
ncbi:transcription termination/antitermination protein NusA [Patescibacteria group bacterium]|nr:transcription termination/antitermination protein NusA [Patescibacteria group bacterium]